MQATTVRMEQHIAVLLNEIKDKRELERGLIKSKQAITAQAIIQLHKKEFK